MMLTWFYSFKIESIQSVKNLKGYFLKRLYAFTCDNTQIRSKAQYLQFLNTFKIRLEL